MTDDILTLKQIQQRLRTKQHVLIHLCEKGVIEPDVQQTQGRGIHREFSQRNLFEFALALTIRSYGIPVMTTAAVIKLLKSFERSTQRKMKGFNLVEFLRSKDPMNIVLFLFDGEYMAFVIEQGGKSSSVTGFNLEKMVSGEMKQVKIDHLEDLPDVYNSYLKLDLKRIFKRSM